MEGAFPVITTDPNIVLGRRLHVPDSVHANRSINNLIGVNFNPMNIYEIKVLPAD